MADFVPPSNPPPPKVPEGFKAVWNDQYKEYFFVNIYTKKSQWDRPTEPVYPSGDQAPGGPPPGYDHSSAVPPSAEKGVGGADGLTEDERLARKLQDEENARAYGSSSGAGPGGPGDRGAADTYYQQPYGQQDPYVQQPGYGQQSPSPAGMYGDPNGPGSQSKGAGGLLGKLLGKNKPQQQYPPQQYPQQQYYGQQQQQGYGYPQQQGMPGRKPGGGLGMAGAAGLGVGGGLLGGMLLESAIDHHGGDGGDGGGRYGGDDGGYGGDDGSYGGDDGGGDGGGDFGGDFGGDGGGDGGGD